MYLDTRKKKNIDKIQWFPLNEDDKFIWYKFVQLISDVQVTHSSYTLYLEAVLDIFSDLS